jgi:hypothetical protein
LKYSLMVSSVSLACPDRFHSMLDSITTMHAESPERVELTLKVR